MIEHNTQAEVSPGHWVPARPCQGTGFTRRFVRRRCVARGGHCEHPANERDPAYCCGCGRPARWLDRVMRR